MITLEERVAQYHTDRLQKFLRRMAFIFVITLISIGGLQLHAWWQYYRAKNKLEELRSYHSLTAHRWGQLQKTAKKHKLLLKEHKLLQVAPLRELLEDISGAIPTTTLLHELQFIGTQNLTIKGYSASPHELATFILSLTHRGITLKDSVPSIHGVTFTLTTLG